MQPPDDDRRFANNPFARAVSPEPDDERAKSPGMYIVVGVLSLVLAALFVAALVLPPMFTYSLIVRGVRSSRPGMLLAGLVMAALYFAVLFSVGRRVMGKPKAPPPEN
jgi:hypothetical protein